MEAIQTDAYSVFFASQAFSALRAHLEGSDYSRVFVLTDTNTARDCYPILIREFEKAEAWPHISIPAGEIHKTIATCTTVWEALSRQGADRQSLLVNLGGGVVTDLGGFVASTYQRGIDFLNIPTTLLSMVDASVGGKTGVDLGSLKNQIGLIQQPEMVLILPAFLRTLESRELRSGYAEMLKHGLIRDRAYWKALSKLKPADVDLARIHHSVGIKNKVVQADPREKGVRKILNFGHTLGHAVESFFLNEQQSPTLLHGEAIAIGMILEAYLSVHHCGLSQEACDEIKDVFGRLFPKVEISETQVERICSLLIHDKKNTHGRIRFTLLRNIGEAVYDQEVTEPLLRQAFAYYKD
jgi:3-dehydroquinate synthase